MTRVLTTRSSGLSIGRVPVSGPTSFDPKSVFRVLVQLMHTYSSRCPIMSRIHL
jgi:hypothetical protein